MAIPKLVTLRVRPRAYALLGVSVVAVLAALLLALSMNAPEATQAAGGSSSPSAGGDGLRMLSADANGVELELDVARYVLSQRESDGQRFEELSVAGAVPGQSAPGIPQLPVRTVLLAIPQDAEVQISISGQSNEDLPQRVRLLPVPTAQVALSPSDPVNISYTGVKYLPDAAAYNRDRFEPAAAAQVVKTGNLRSQRYAALALYPFQYNAAQQSLRWNKHIHVSLRFVYPRGKDAAAMGTSRDEGAYEAILQGQLLNYDSARSWRAPRAASAGPARPQSPATAAGQFRISTDQEGIYRLTYATLISAGVSATDTHTFKIFKNGVEIPIYVSSDPDGVFDADDYIEFYAQAIDNAYTNVNVYWLSAGGNNGLRMATRTVAPSSAMALSSFRDRAHFEDNHIWYPVQPQGNGDHWFWQGVTTSDIGNPFYIASPAVFTFTLPAAGTVGTATLRTNVEANFGTAGAPTPHYQKVYVNGQLVIDDPWVGNITRQTQGIFAESYFVTGTNSISYNLVLTAGSGFDGLVFNWYEVDYDHLYRAQNDYLAFGADVSGAAQLTISNFTTNSLALYDVTNPTNTVLITGAVVNGSGGGYALSFGDSLSPTTRYVAAAAGKAPLSVVRDTSQSDLHNLANGADEIFITGDDLYTATAPLAALRTSQGLRTIRVRISDVYREFSDGVFDPPAIQRFLSYTYAYWGGLPPQYVLLVGNGNLNYRNFQPNNFGLLDVDLIPPFMDSVDPFANQAATDNHYVSFGSDNMPYMALGRLPVRTVTETNIVVSKIISYEQTPAPGGWRRTVDFFSDAYYRDNGTYDPGGDFYGASDGIASRIPNAYTITRAYYCPDPCPPNNNNDPWYITETVNADPVHVRQAITTDIRSGALFVNYVGHASPNQWGNAAIFYNAGASPPYPLPDPLSQLNNGPRMPIVLELTCRSGAFFFPGFTTLAESWLSADGRGAVADWASTGLGVNDGHRQMAQTFYDSVYLQHIGRVGLAINSSKSYLVTTGQYLDLVDEFTLFGDPATVIQLPIIPQMYLPLVSR